MERNLNGVIKRVLEVKGLRIELTKVQEMKQKLHDGIVEAAQNAFVRKGKVVKVVNQEFKKIWDELNDSYYEVCKLENQLKELLGAN